jgi:hypothetical protein
MRKSEREREREREKEREKRGHLTYTTLKRIVDECGGWNIVMCLFHITCIFLE